MSLQLDDALSQYASALSNLEQSDAPTSEAVLVTLIHRDRVQAALHQNSVASEQLITLLQYDSRLRNWAKSRSTDLNFENWRPLINPPEQSWWWFLDRPNGSQQIDALNTYEQLVLGLESSHFIHINQSLPVADVSGTAQRSDTDAIEVDLVADAVSPLPRLDNPLFLTRRILELYIVRDVLQQQVAHNDLGAEKLEKLSWLDDRFRQQLETLPQQIDRRSLEGV